MQRSTSILTSGLASLALVFTVSCGGGTKFNGSSNKSEAPIAKPGKTGKPKSQNSNPKGPGNSGSTKDRANSEIKNISETVWQKKPDDKENLTTILDCTLIQTKEVQIEKSIKNLHLNLVDPCVRTWQEFDQIKTKNIDIVILLDITGSMQPSIDVVKTNIIQFAVSMEEKGWNAQFSLIAYRDQIIETTDFKSASKIASDLNRQIAEEGGGVAEAGQLGFFKSLEILKTQKRPSAIPAILMISDAPSWSNDELDLSTDKWQREIDAALESPELKNLQLYTSVGDAEDVDIPIDVNPFSVEFEELIANMKSGAAQIKEIREKTTIKGTSLNFPFAPTVLLDSLVISIQEVSRTVKVSCDLKGVTIDGKSTEIYLDDSNKKYLSIDLSQVDDSLEMKVERDCEGNQKVELIDLKLETI